MTTTSRFLSLAGLCFLSMNAIAHAQPGPVVSPEVHRDGSVTFRLAAPNAGNVALVGLRRPGPSPLAKGQDGVWSITVGPLEPEIYEYHFDVDGARVVDPRNRVVKKWLDLDNLVEVRGEAPRLHELQPVPHGEVHRLLYRSTVRGADTPVIVYTPPGYDEAAAVRHPVVYLLHGYGDDETAWSEVGRAHFIAENLQARKLIAPCLVVMPHGHPVPIPDARFDDYAPGNLAVLERDLIESLIPFIDARFKTNARPADRAIMGLSMGGEQALTIGLGHPDVFQWICGYSSAAPERDLAGRFARLLQGEAPRLLWIGCGREDFLLERNKTFIAWLEQNQIGHTWRLSDGGHEWPVWRAYLAETLPLLFRPAGGPAG